MESVGVISLIIDVSKDLYTYYRAVRDCDTDIKELRTQLLSLHRTANILTTALKRDGMSAEDKSQVDAALIECEDAAKELKSALDRIKVDNVQPHTALMKMKAAGRKAVYPFRKKTVAGLSEDVESCQDALHVAVSILQLNIGATTVEQLVKLDDRLVASTTTLESALRDLGLAYDTGKVEIVQLLLQNRKMLAEGENRKKAKSIVESLKYPQMTDRMWQVRAADDFSLGALFVGEESRRHPQIMSLLSFLEGDSGLFWIQGKPASGKSTLMKYLLSRSRGPAKLWKRSDQSKTIFASHFCWIAGSTMQKSQQGLLQSLLHQILSADLALVPTACSFQWSSDSHPGQWHEKWLWDSLYTAVAASDSQISFFVDGLDELQPEEDHICLAKALNRLSSYGNVKLIVSSRPWAAFERNLDHGGKVMIMEHNNRLAIARYVRGELEKHATHEASTHVSWDCIYKGSCEPQHDHTVSHHLARRITTKANGVFLWASLVMKAVGRHVALGCPVSVLEIYVGKLPTELGEYFRKMIFERIHESLLSETAMALSIALLARRNLCNFALLCTYMDTGVSWLTDPEFVSKLPCTTITPAEVTEIIRKTLTFLRVCCRDILDCPPPPPSIPGFEWQHFMLTCIDFSHRAVFEYVHTPEMQLLLRKHTPDHFKDALFTSNLDVAFCKMVVMDPHDIVCPVSGWEQLSFCAQEIPYWGDHEIQSAKTRTPDFDFHKTTELAQILEEVSLYHLR